MLPRTKVVFNNLSSKIAELVRLEIQRQTAVSVDDDDVESDDIHFASNSKQTSVNKNGGQKQRQHTKKSNIQPIDSLLLNLERTLRHRSLILQALHRLIIQVVTKHNNTWIIQTGLAHSNTSKILLSYYHQ